MTSIKVNSSYRKPLQVHALIASYRKLENDNNNNNNNGLITLQKLIGSSMLHKYLNNYNIYITITII